MNFTPNIALDRPYLIAILAYCGLIFFLSHQPELPDTGLPEIIPYFDKVAHTIMFGGLAGVLSVGIRRSNRNVRLRIQFFVPILFVLFYGMSDEIHQIFIPNRTFDLLDLAADVAGAAAVQSALCFQFWKLRFRPPGFTRAEP